MIEEEKIEYVLKESYLTYAMSVIVSRALPDVRDGLKPVHRRLLYAMYELGNFHNKPYKKSARIVGEVLGKYHPHGDSAIYDALVRMAQPFSLRYLLVDGQGNFGSIDGDAPAAMRYTEVRMTKLAEEMLKDIEKETVEFHPNFDNTLKEPLVLPSRIPNLIINGSSGIAVGMATNIPPHNLGEVVDALIALIEGKEDEIFSIIKGPDFPTGGIIVNKDEIIRAYKTGKGIIKVRGKAEIKEDRILITEIPYQVSKSKIINDIVEAVKNKKIENIIDLIDKSDKRGMLIEIKLRKNSNPEVVLNKLYKYTSLEVSFGIIMIALVGGAPKLLSLKEILEEFIKFRFEIIRKRTSYLKKKAEERRHILIGLLKALNRLEETVELIKSSKNYEEAKSSLIELLDIDEMQAKSILDMRLHRLISSEREKIEEEKKELDKRITEYDLILREDSKVYEIIKEELLEIKESYADERRTEILESYKDVEIEDLIPNERSLIVYSQGYVKRIPLNEFKAQHRGGRGISLIGELSRVAYNHDVLYIFTNKGKVYTLKAYEIPKLSRNSKGKPLLSLIKLSEGEKVVDILASPQGNYFTFATKKGLVKRTEISQYINAKKAGIRAILLEEKDSLVKILPTSGSDLLILATKNGYSIVFNEQEVRKTGRTSQGVKGISLEDDEVISLTKVRGPFLLSLTSKGYGKLTPISSFRTQHRGGKGLIVIKTTEKTGFLKFSISVNEDEEFFVLTKYGKIIRLKVKEISIQSRYAKGVRIIRLEEGDEIQEVSLVKNENITS